MRILIVCNPISGGGRAAREAARLRDLLQAGGHRVELFRTGRPGDARARAARLEDALERLVVVGGDGTLNEVVNGLADPRRVPLTQLATGTANLLAHDLALPRRAEGVARLIENGALRRLDLGLANGRRFLMVVSSGFDAAVTHETQGRRSGPTTYASWIPAILRIARGYRPPRLRVSIDGAAPIDGGLVIVSNVRNYGGLFTVADRAVCDSGVLDVCILTRAALPALLRAAVAGLTGGLSRMTGVVYAQGRAIQVVSDDPAAVEIDGDPFGSTPVEIELLPRQLPVVVPRGSAKAEGH